MPQDLQQPLEAVGHQSQQQLKLLPSQAMDPQPGGTGCRHQVRTVLCMDSGPPPSPPSLNPKRVLRRRVSAAMLFPSAVTQQESNELPTGDTC